MTDRELVATARVPLDRLNQLSIAARGDAPSELTNVERVVFEAMRRQVEQMSGVMWASLDTTLWIVVSIDWERDTPTMSNGTSNKVRIAVSLEGTATFDFDTAEEQQEFVRAHSNGM